MTTKPNVPIIKSWQALVGMEVCLTTFVPECEADVIAMNKVSSAVKEGCCHAIRHASADGMYELLNVIPYALWYEQPPKQHVCSLDTIGDQVYFAYVGVPDDVPHEVVDGVNVCVYMHVD